MKTNRHPNPLYLQQLQKNKGPGTWLNPLPNYRSK